MFFASGCACATARDQSRLAKFLSLGPREPPLLLFWLVRADRGHGSGLQPGSSASQPAASRKTLPGRAFRDQVRRFEIHRWFAPWHPAFARLLQRLCRWSSEYKTILPPLGLCVLAI